MKAIYFATVLCAASLFASSAYGVKQVEVLKRDGHQNEIPLLDNRFRIDSNIDEITLLFFRKPGTSSVILVRPDGSKYFTRDAAHNAAIEWFDELNYDLITIKKPMPGPWQVIGGISPKSRIVVLGEISLAAEPLPSMLFKGETIKITGKILNDGEPIDENLFRDVVKLNVDFVSTNNDSFANFGAGGQKVAEFKDDGRGFDERPRDGVFTGEFRLDFPAGEWASRLYISTPLLKRRVVQDKVLVHEPPFSYAITLADDNVNDHHLTINLDTKIVKSETVVIQGKIYYPNNEEQMFTIDAVASDSRQLSIKNYDWGRYSVELSVFGTNINGREFMATLPTYRFAIERPIKVIPKTDSSAFVTSDKVIERESVEEKMATSMIVSLIVGCNTFILLLGWLFVRIFVQKKPINFKVKLPFVQKNKASERGAADKEKNRVDKNGSKNDKSGGILNLSMTDD